MRVEQIAALRWGNVFTPDSRVRSRELFLFKSPLSRQILLTVTRYCGVCELRKLFKLMEATAIAIRLHVQPLEEEGFVELCPHETNRRCKLIKLTDKGWTLMREYERQCQQALSGWRQPKARN